MVFVMFGPFQHRADEQTQKGGNMKEKIIAILAVIAVIAAIGLVGSLDHDEYIEVNSTAKPRFIK